MKINDARLNLIRADLEKYKEIRKAKNILYKKDAELEHSINRNILLMTHGEDVVDQIESLVGKRIMYWCQDECNVIEVKRVKYAKWELTLMGSGFRYYHGNVYDNTWLDIKYEYIDEKLADLKICKDGSLKELTDMLEESKKSAIENFINATNKQYDKVMASIKNYLENGDNGEEIHSFCLSMADRSVMDEVSRFSMKQLVREFGSSEEKAKLKKTPSEIIADDGPDFGDEVDVCDDDVEDWCEGED